MTLQEVTRHSRAFNSLTGKHFWSQEESGIPLHVWLTMWGSTQYTKAIHVTLEKYEKYLNELNEDCL